MFKTDLLNISLTKGKYSKQSICIHFTKRKRKNEGKKTTISSIVNLKLLGEGIAQLNSAGMGVDNTFVIIE